MKSAYLSLEDKADLQEVGNDSNRARSPKAMHQGTKQLKGIKEGTRKRGSRDMHLEKLAKNLIW